MGEAIAILHSLISTPLCIFSARLTTYDSDFGSDNSFRHTCTGGAQSLVATARAPVWEHHKRFQVVVLKRAYAHYGKHVPGHL